MDVLLTVDERDYYLPGFLSDPSCFQATAFRNTCSCSHYYVMVFGIFYFRAFGLFFQAYFIQVSNQLPGGSFQKHYFLTNPVSLITLSNPAFVAPVAFMTASETSRVLRSFPFFHNNAAACTATASS